MVLNIAASTRRKREDVAHVSGIENDTPKSRLTIRRYPCKSAELLCRSSQSAGWALRLALWLLTLTLPWTSSSFADTWQVRRLCERHDGKIVAKTNGVPRLLTCADVIRHWQELQLPDTPFSRLRDRLLRGPRNIDQIPVDKHCARDLSASRPYVRCSMAIHGAPVTVHIQANSAGLIEIYTIDIQDARPALQPYLDNVRLKFGVDEITDELVDYVLDLLVLKSQQASLANEIYERRGFGIFIRLIKEGG